MRSPLLSSPLLASSILGLVAAAPFACATSVRVIDDGEGGEGGESSSSVVSGSTTSSSGNGGGGGGGGLDGGIDGSGGAGGVDAGGPCGTDADCAAVADKCNAGQCVGGTCHKVPINDFKACDDGLFCTLNDICVQGKCTAGSSKICPGDPKQPCMAGSCNEATDKCELVPSNEGGICDDGDPCTDLGTCSNGTCLSGATKDCSFLDTTCTVGACDPVKGCVAQPQPDGTLCDDLLFCTVNDACQAGKCAGQPNPCGAPNDPCKIAQCDEVQKKCTAVAGNDGAACDDGNLCTTGELCSAGKCSGGAPANPGLTCNDNNACTAGESCQSGVCGGGTPIVACASGDGCCPAGCNSVSDSDCKQVKVGVMGGSFYTDDLRAYLATQPFILSAAQSGACDLASLKQYDVVIVWGNMNCFDAASFNAYVQGGGGLIGTPWIYNNNQGLDSLPVSGSSVNTHFNDPLQVTVTDASDVLLQGVNFNAGDPVGWEEWNFSLKVGATSSVVWQGGADKHAVAKWAYGSGRAVYLDFHYITSDCSLAIKYDWGKKLVYNSVLWAGKAL